MLNQHGSSGLAPVDMRSTVTLMIPTDGREDACL